MYTARVEKAEYGNREFVSGETDMMTATVILNEIVIGFKNAGYTRANDELYRELPEGVEILRSGMETVAFRVVAA